MRNDYELKQAILDKMENELLIEKIMKLEKKIGELEAKIRYEHLTIKTQTNEKSLRIN